MGDIVPNIAFLYAGPIDGRRSSHYPEYSTADIQSYTAVNEFVISGSSGYTSSYPAAELIFTFQALAKTIVTVKPEAQLWLATPHETAYTNSFEQKQFYYTYIEDLKAALGPAIWNHHVKGIYMHNERIAGDFETEYEQLPQLPQLRLYGELSLCIRRLYRKQFLWAPYYGYNYTWRAITQAVGYVANRTSLFDYVLIQPHYYFEPIVNGDNTRPNLEAVRRSASEQAVVYRDGTVVGGCRSSFATAAIGIQMEIDSRVCSDKAFRDRYLEYVQAYKDQRGNAPFGFYHGSRGESNYADLVARVNDFYEPKTC